MPPKKARGFAKKSNFFNCATDANFTIRVMKAILEEGRAGKKIQLSTKVFQYSVLKRLKASPNERAWNRVVSTIHKFNLRNDVRNLHLPTVDELIRRQNKRPRSNDDKDDDDEDDDAAGSDSNLQ